MLYWVVRKNCEAANDPETDFYLTESQLVQAVLRNFGGSDEFHPLEEFQDCLQSDILEEVFVFVLYCIALHCIALHCIVLYCIVLYCIVLYCIVLYCIVLYCISN